MANKHSNNTQPVAPIVYAVGVEYKEAVKGEVLTYGTVRREVMNPGPGAHITYVVKNRMGAELIVDADSIDALIAALQQARRQDQL